LETEFEEWAKAHSIKFAHKKNKQVAFVVWSIMRDKEFRNKLEFKRVVSELEELKRFMLNEN